MKLDTKKVKALAVTYGAIALPLASAAYAMNASNAVKVLSFLSGLLPVVTRQLNPHDPFTCNLMAIAEVEINEILKKEKDKKD